MTKRLSRMINAYIAVFILAVCFMMFAYWVEAAYLVPANEVGTTLSNDFVYGTDAVVQITSLTDFPTTGGVVRIDDGTHWCLVKYATVDAGTIELRTLTHPVADYESTAAHTFAAGVEVWLVCAADYITQLITALPDTTTDNAAARYDGAIGKIQNSGLIIDDSVNLSGIADASLDTITSDGGTTINIVLGSDAGDDLLIDTDKVTVEGDTGRVGINDTTPDATLDVEGNAFIGDATNYVEIKTDGEVNLHGTARVINHVRVAAPSWEKGAPAPTTDLIGITPTLRFDAVNDDEVYYSCFVPFRMAAGSTITVIVGWAYDGGQDNGTVCWNMEYINIAEGEAVAGGTTTITKTTAGTHATGTLIETTLTTGITGAVAGDVLSMRLWRDVSEDTLATDAELIMVYFHFLRDKMGEAT